jgi:hypothetical protein
MFRLVGAIAPNTYEMFENIKLGNQKS